MSATERHIGFDHVVTSHEELEAIIGPPDGAVKSKIIDHLDVHCREFIARAPFFVLATCDASGRCDVSPRGGPPGFVEVIDEKRLVWADAKGNRLIDSHRGVLDLGRVGMLFMIPGLKETLRVNGRACLTQDPAILARHVIQEGRPPRLAVGVEVEEAFLHCAKALIRSTLWSPDTWPALDGMARPAQVWRDHIALPDVTLDAIDELVEHAYEHELY
jgi:PPOX class probable FMN-dependent enzyme